MSGGYVLDFNNSTFSEFLLDQANIDIYGSKYDGGGDSKAKRLRTFWNVESDHVVGSVMLTMIDYSQEIEAYHNTGCAEECRAIANRLVGQKANLQPLKEIATQFDAKHLTQQIDRMDKAIDSDPDLAIGTAKEIIETCCKTILSERGIAMTGKEDIPKLTQMVLKELKLVPDGVPEAKRGRDVIKRILKTLGTIGNDLAELRGLYGTGHGKDGNAKGLTPRHARLAAGVTATMARFLFDTHKEIV